jgi:flotillin
MIFVLFLIGLALTIGPWFVPQFESGLRLAISFVGLGILLITAIAAVITRLYRKASANMAFVRTGMGGAKPILDGGAIVVPVIHQVIPVSLETMRLNVERRGARMR